MLKKIDLNPEQNETYSSCVVAGDFIFASHQGGAHCSDSIVVQLEACFRSLEHTLAAAESTLDDVVQINLLLKNADDFQQAQGVCHLESLHRLMRSPIREQIHDSEQLKVAEVRA